MASIKTIIDSGIYDTSGFTARTCHSMILNSEDQIEAYNIDAYSASQKLNRNSEGELVLSDYFNNNAEYTVADNTYFKCPFSEVGRNEDTREGICGYCAKPISINLIYQDQLVKQLKFSIDKANVLLSTYISDVDNAVLFETSPIGLTVEYNETVSINETLDLLDTNSAINATFVRN
jgi:hypothetical protein